MSTYRFPGMPVFVVKEGVSPSFAQKISGLFFVARAGDALAQVGEAKPEHRLGLIQTAYEARQGLVNALATLDAAIAEVERECQLQPTAEAELIIPIPPPNPGPTEPVTPGTEPDPDLLSRLSSSEPTED